MSQFSNKRKLNDAEEEMVLERIKAGDKYHEIAAAFNISMTTVSKIKKGRPSKEELEAARDTMIVEEPPSVKKLAEYYPLMNKRMLEWVAQAQKRNVRITSAMLQDRAKIVADSIGWTSFRASSGWCVKFLRRHNIKLRQLKRKAQLKSTCQEGTKWEEKILNPRLNADGSAVEADTSDSEDLDEEDGLGSDSDDDVLGTRTKVPSLERARKAWNTLQEWFISHPPTQDRVMQAVFIINKEMMQPSSVSLGDSAGAGGHASAGAAPVPLPLGGAGAGSSSLATADDLGLQQAGDSIAAKLPKKRPPANNAAALPVSAGNTTNFFQNVSR